MAVFLQNLGISIARLYLVLSYLHASSIHRAEPLSSLIYKGKIMLKKLNRVIEAHSDNDIIDFINYKLGENAELVFELNINFNFDLRHFDEVLNKDNLSLSIHFDTEMKNFLKDQKIESNKYVDKFLNCLQRKDNLTNLKLTFLNLTEIPRGVYELINLKVLSLSSNKLKDCKLASEYLQNLENLDISCNKDITSIDDSILNLSALREFNACECSITELPESMINLMKLTNMNLNRNPITHVAKNFSNFQELKWVFISDCKFEEFVIDMSENINLRHVNLDSNPYLKYCKILIPKVPQKLSKFCIKNCPLINIKVYLNLTDDNLRYPADLKDKYSKKFEYILNLSPTKLFNFNRVLAESDSKIFNYHIDTSLGSSKIISISQFNFEYQKNVIARDELIAKWNSVCIKYNLNCMEHKRGTKFLKSLYKMHNNTYSSYENILLPEYKVKMIIILSSLFNRLEADDLVFEVVDMLEIFEGSQPEQLIYFNYLLNITKFHSHDIKSFLRFIKESIEILRDYALTVCLNLEENNKNQELKDIINGNSVLLGSLTSSEEIKNELWHKWLCILIKAQTRFNSYFTIDYISKIFSSVIDKVCKPKLFNEEIYNFLLEKCEIGVDFFDYETEANVIIVKKVSIQGIKTLIKSIEYLERFIK